MDFDSDNPLLVHCDSNNPRIIQNIITDDVLQRHYPHRVIIRAYLCTGKQFYEQRRFCDMLHLSLCEKVGSTWINETSYRIFAFAEHHHAQVFAARFNGRQM